jgi:hypothetical protein
MLFLYKRDYIPLLYFHMLVTRHRVWTKKLNNYMTVCNLHMLRITIAHTGCSVFASHYLVVVANSLTSAPVLMSLLAGYLTSNLRLPSHDFDSTGLSSWPWHWAFRKHCFHQFLCCCMLIHCCRNMFWVPFPSNCHLISLHHSCFHPSFHNMI